MSVTTLRRRPPASIHGTAIVYPNVEVGDGSTVGANCILGSRNGDPLVIGPDSVIRAGTIIYGGSDIGGRLETGHHALIRSGNTIGENLRLGSYSSLEGGAKIGDFCRIHGRCEMTRGILRDFVRVYGGSYITDNRNPPSYVNDVCELFEGSVVMMGCILVGGVVVGLGGQVAAGVVASRNVRANHILLRDGTQRPVRELWPSRYMDDYPSDAQERLHELLRRMEAAWRRRP